MDGSLERPRIFLGPIEIAGFFSGLETGLREIGLAADCHDTSGDPFRYRQSGRPWTGEVDQGRPAAGLLNRTRHRIARLVLFFRAIARYDVFIIGGTGFLSGRELPILRWLGKRVVWVFLGTDHRPPYLNGKVTGPGAESGALRRETARTAARVRRVERYAHAVVAHEASAQFHRRPFVRLLEVGIPVAIDAPPTMKDPSPRGRGAKPVRVLHCPTDPVAKGSIPIRAMVHALAAEGSIEYLELSGKPHRDVLAQIPASDVVIDQLYGDTPLAVLATEAAWLGTPAISGGYFAEGHCRQLEDGTAFPEGFVAPGEVEGLLERLTRHPEVRRRLAESSGAFVRSRWPARKVAERMDSVIKGRARAGWMIDPATVQYIDGYGMSRSERIARVRAFVDAEGERALALEHRPDLVKALLAT
jgi:hypothetical protein